MTLAALRAHVLSVVPPDLLSPAGEWVHADDLRRYYGAIEDRWNPGEEGKAAEKLYDRLGHRLVKHAQDLLKGFADSLRCRAGRPRWLNPGYCPPSPYGAYVWHFHVGVVQGIVGFSRVFRKGVAFGRNPRPPFRDANPYKGDTRRAVEWDRGYILGLAWEKVEAWYREKTAALADRGPAPAAYNPTPLTTVGSVTDD